MNLAVRLARREMRSGLGGFRLFIACLALGVAAIAGILSFSRAVEEGLRADARDILGGDVAISLLYREATPEQVAFMKMRGELVRFIDSRAMARPTKPDGRPTLVQLKAVEAAYPLYGAVTFLNVNGNPNTPWKFDWNNWQPRVGAAYQLNEKTVLRAGYGRYFENPTAQGFTNGFSTSPRSPGLASRVIATLKSRSLVLKPGNSDISRRMARSSIMPSSIILHPLREVSRRAGP